MMRPLRFLVVLALFVLSRLGHAQENADVLILFLDEPVPPGAVKLGEKKVSEPYDCYSVFEENIVNRATKFKANLAKVESYRLPSVWQPGHSGQVSFYNVTDIQRVKQHIIDRRDSIEHEHILTLGNKSKIYFFRPASSIKLAYDLYLNDQRATEIKMESIFSYDPVENEPLLISAKYSINSTDIQLPVKEDKVYYVECRTLGQPPFALFPRFCLVTYSPGKFLYEELEKKAQSKSTK